jgi:hypothetical protein
MNGRRAMALVLVGTMLGAPHPAAAYLHLSTTRGGGGVVALKWDVQRVRWFASDRTPPGMTPADFQTALARAFTTWEEVPTASAAFQFVGFTSAEPLDDDNMSVLGFLDEPDMDRVLGATSFVTDVQTGALVEADIYFNAAFPWSASLAGDANRFDLQSIATHEIGHFLGLGHSALGETESRPDGGRRVLAAGSVMFPIAFGRGNVTERRLHEDDVAGVSDLYPDGSFAATTGTLRGRVRLGGRGVLGAHVQAFNPATGAIVAGFALTREGEYRIAGLVPGPYAVRVEPLDDADVESFLSGRGIDVNFQAAFHDRLVVSPRGGSSAPFDVLVQPK